MSTTGMSEADLIRPGDFTGICRKAGALFFYCIYCKICHSLGSIGYARMGYSSELKTRFSRGLGMCPDKPNADVVPHSTACALLMKRRYAPLRGERWGLIYFSKMEFKSVEKVGLTQNTFCDYDEHVATKKKI